MNEQIKSVFDIATDRAAQAGQLHPYLVGTPRCGFHLDQVVRTDGGQQAVIQFRLLGVALGFGVSMGEVLIPVFFDVVHQMPA